MYAWFVVALMLGLFGLDGWFLDDGLAGPEPAVVQDDGGSVSARDGNEPPPPPK